MTALVSSSSIGGTKTSNGNHSKTTPSPPPPLKIAIPTKHDAHHPSKLNPQIIQSLIWSLAVCQNHSKTKEPLLPNQIHLITVTITCKTPRYSTKPKHIQTFLHGIPVSAQKQTIVSKSFQNQDIAQLVYSIIQCSDILKLIFEMNYMYKDIDLKLSYQRILIERPPLIEGVSSFAA
jgi:hypothetical protein